MSTAAAQSPSIAVVRAVVIELRDLGLEDPSEDLRVGSAAMGEACITAFRRRSDVSFGWLRSAIRAGGSWSAVQRELVPDSHRRERAERSGLLRDALAAQGVEV